MAQDSAISRARARRSYELGRLFRALRWSWFVPVLVVLSILSSDRALISWIVGVCLFALVVFMFWRGQTYERALLFGLPAGTVAFGLPFVARAAGHGCSGGVCCSLCVSVCIVAGALGGLVIGLFRAQKLRLDVCCGLSCVGLMGVLGCIYAGVGGLIGMSFGIVMGFTPALVFSRTHG